MKALFVVAAKAETLFFERKSDAKEVRNKLRAAGEKGVHVSRGPQHLLGASGGKEALTRHRRSLERRGCKRKVKGGKAFAIL